MDKYSSTSDVKCNGGEPQSPPNAGITSSVLPEANAIAAASSHTGVSTSNAPLPKELQESRRAARTPHWYALRCTYGREDKANEYLIKNKVETYYPTIKTIKQTEGKRKTITESRLPNILFARGTEEEIKKFVYDNANLPYLRFYYRHAHEGAHIVKTPLIVPDQQLESLKIICAVDADDIIVAPGELDKFKEGQTVRITDGEFKGVTGKVARYKNHQRVGIIINGLLTVCTAYIPSAFIDIIDD